MATLTQTAPAQQPATTHPFTCNTCQVAFRSLDLQRTHMQSDWHRYNLKRRVASLPPLPSDVFADKVLANKASAAATAARASFEKRCEACEKTYYSENAYTNHLRSQKHRLLATRHNAKAGNETESLDSTFSLGEPMETASTTTESTINGDAMDSRAEGEFDEVVDGIKNAHLQEPTDPPSIHSGTPSNNVHEKVLPSSSADEANEDDEHHADLQQCLFCNYVSPTIDLNVNHMGRQHGFFIPEREYLVQLDGLINYLSETILVLHQCLFCHKMFHTGSGVQTHMRDRGHCMLAYTTEDEQLEIGEFYDFRSTYSDEESEDEEQADENGDGVSLGVKRAVKTTTQNEQGEDVEMEDEDSEGWESDSTLSSVPTDEITSVPIDQTHKVDKLNLHRHHSHTDPRPHKNSDGYHSHAHHTPTAVYHDGYELHLPSGRTAGHRSLRVYYRQNLHSYPTPEERGRQQRLIEEGDGHASDADDEDNEDQSTETGGSRGRQVATRANGGMGMVGVTDAKKREVRVAEKRQQARAQREEKQYQWGNNRAANSQKHFRDPLLQ